jgi:hypothetical protein
MIPGATAVEEEEVKENGTENAEGEENNNPEHQPTGDEDPKPGGKSGENGEAGEEDAGDVESEEEEIIEDPRDAKIAALEADIRAIKEGKAVAPAAPAAQPAKVYTEEEKAQIAERFGVQDFRTVEAFSGMFAQGMMTIRQEFQNELSAFKKDSVISSLSKQKEFADINKYRDGIDEYLKKFSPQYHGDPETIKDGLAWAKGRGLKNSVAKAVSSSEKNRRIAGAARPAAPGGVAPKGGGFKFKLTPTEESVYASVGRQHFKTKEEYARSLKRYKGA